MFNTNNTNNNQENIDDDDDDDDDDVDRQQIPLAYKSPKRSNFFKSRPVSRPEPPVSAIYPITSRSELSRNKGSKSTELERLEKLQERLDEIRNITKRLAQPMEGSRLAKSVSVPSSARMMESHASISPRSVRRKTSPTRHMSLQPPSPARSQSTSSLPPPGSVLVSKSKLFTNVPSYTTNSPTTSPPSRLPPPPPPPPPTHLMLFTGNKEQRESVLPSNKTPIISALSRSSSNSTKDSKYGSHSPSSAMKNVLGDISKAKLRSTETYQTPNGSKTKNKFWEEIHAAKVQESRQPQDESKNTPLRNTPLKTSSSVSTRKGKSPAVKLPNQWEEGDFWTQSSVTNNAFTDKLKRIAQEEEEEGEKEREWEHRLSFTQTPDSLGNELEAATRKEQKDAREKERAELELSSFLLEPAASESGGSLRSREVCHVIDGDEWTFAGKQYTVNEKKRKM
ncbi:hypothetical protein BDC45DRAFT_109714 [Circinella umbellata]|nr:hypothetical protein BDC45DRAFT_109714 [Circinella umbellata]